MDELSSFDMSSPYGISNPTPDDFLVSTNDINLFDDNDSEFVTLGDMEASLTSVDMNGGIINPYVDGISFDDQYELVYPISQEDIDTTHHAGSITAVDPLCDLEEKLPPVIDVENISIEHSYAAQPPTNFDNENPLSNQSAAGQFYENFAGDIDDTMEDCTDEVVHEDCQVQEVVITHSKENGTKSVQEVTYLVKPTNAMGFNQNYTVLANDDRELIQFDLNEQLPRVAGTSAATVNSYAINPNNVAFYNTANGEISTPQFITISAAHPRTNSAAPAHVQNYSFQPSYQQQQPFIGIEERDDRVDGRNGRPRYSYIQLIMQALLESPENKLTLAQIYNYIIDTYPYYNRLRESKGWKNSIRHNLSLNPNFMHIQREVSSTPRKGGFWGIEPRRFESVRQKAYERRRTTGKRRKKDRIYEVIY